MGRSLTNKIWRSFTQVADDNNNLSSYENYFNALASWLRSNKSFIGDESIINFELDTILDINPSDYIVKTPPISLQMEYKRMFENRPENLDLLIMHIGKTLWDLISVSAKKDCPICIHGELRYFRGKQITGEVEKIILECMTCTFLENIDGTSADWGGKLIKVYPINESDLIKNGVSPDEVLE